VHESEPRVDEIEVVVQIFSSSVDDFQLLALAVAPDVKGPSNLQSGEDTDQTLLDTVPLRDPAGGVLLGAPIVRRESRLKIFQRTPLLLRELLDVGLEFLRRALHVIAEVLEQDPLGGKKLSECILREKPGEVPVEDHPVEGAELAHGFGLEYRLE
jgi:hypothetical protein